MVKAKQNLEVREIWGHLCCWCNYTQVHTSPSLNHVIHTLQLRFPKVKRMHQALGNGKREFKKKNTIRSRESHQVPKAHSWGIQKPSQGPPAFSRYGHCLHTLKTPQPFPSKSLTLLLIQLQRDTFPRRLEMGHNSTGLSNTAARSHRTRPPLDMRPLGTQTQRPSKIQTEFEDLV